MQTKLPELSQKRGKFDLQGFMRQYKLGDPIGATYFISKP